MAFTATENGEKKPFDKSTGTDDEKTAKKIWQMLKAKIALGQWHPETLTQEQKKPDYVFSDLVECYSAWAAPRHKGWREVEKTIVRQLKKRFGTVKLEDFTTYMVEQLQSDELARGLVADTVNRTTTTFKGMFSRATDWDMIDEVVLKRIRKAKQLKNVTYRLRFLSLEECQALIDACATHLKPIVVTALNTGLRKSNILNLRWDQVDLKHGFILLENKTLKNGQRLEIPINDMLRATLQGLTRRLDVPYVFYDVAKGNSYGDIKKSFATALKNAELEKCTKCDYHRLKGRDQKIAGQCPRCNSEMAVFKGIRDFHFHDLRHTFASHLVMAGVDLTTVKELLGHKDIKMTLRYAHLAPAHKAEAVKKLGNLFAPQSLVQSDEKMVNYCTGTEVNSAAGKSASVSI